MSNKLKRTVKYLLISVGGFGLLYFLFGIFVGLTSGESIERSSEILGNFKESASFVDVFKKTNQRLPNQKEIESHFGEQYPVSITEFHDVNKPTFLKEAPANSYVLHFWRGAPCFREVVA